jgi:hypothetical protein
MHMKSKWPLSFAVLTAGAFAAAFSLDVDNPLLKGHTEKLRQAPSITINFSVNRIGSEVEDDKLVISRVSGSPRGLLCNGFKKDESVGLLRWETPRTITILNGNQIITFDKKSNNYYEEPADAASLTKLFGNDVIWAWSAMIDPTFMKSITDAKVGASRKVKGVAVKELNVARGTKVVTFFVDDQLGFARGATFQEDKGGQKVTVLITASDIQIGKDSLEGDKLFMVPSGATKVDKAALATTFADASQVLRGRCGCHQNGAPGGLSLASYMGVMKGGNNGPVVKPGDAAGSKLIGVINGTMSPKMPPQGSLSAEQIAVLTKWINDGAKE